MADVQLKLRGYLSWSDDEKKSPPERELSPRSSNGAAASSGAGGGPGASAVDQSHADVVADAAPTPGMTSRAGWAALLRLPRGLFSLKVNGSCLGYDSYDLLREHVTVLHCSKVSSPAELVNAKARLLDSEATAARDKALLEDFERRFGAEGLAKRRSRTLL